jgi:carboxymethylenebutenolidase
MKKITSVAIIIMLLYLHHANAQTKSCCNLGATNEFAMLGKSSDFQQAHSAPEALNFTPTTDVTFAVADGKNGSAYFVKTEIKSKKFLFVFHEWWGLNGHIKKETELLAAELSMLEINVIAIDLYDGKIATNADEAGKFMQEVNQERAIAIINGAIQYAGNDAEIQTIGWCFGGGWSLQATILAAKQSRGCVMYYGMPEKDIERLKKIESPVLGIFASKDGWINKPLIDEFEKKMKSANKMLDVKWYDADHAFANPSNPTKYDKTAADAANKVALDFISTNFRIK